MDTNTNTNININTTINPDSNTISIPPATSLTKVVDLRQEFPFIHQMLSDGFKTNSILFTYPYDGFEKIDNGFRRMMWTNYERPDPSTMLANQDRNYQILIIKSSLKFYNIIAFTSLDEHPDFISIGPFRDEDITSDFFAEIFAGSDIPTEQMLLMKQFYQVLPMAAVNDVVNMFRHLLAHYIPEYAGVVPEIVNYSEQTHTISPSEDGVNEYAYDYAQKYSYQLNHYLDAITTGDYSQTIDYLNALMDLLQISGITTLGGLRRIMNTLNTHCKGRLLNTTVNPVYTLRLWNSYEMMINTTVNHQQLVNLPAEMTRKYCLLIRNYEYPDYSYQTRNIIAYITQNLSEELSLSDIAEHFHKNASFLSGLFSKEMGQSITSYIHEQRINEAIKLFNTTELSVADVASQVGIHDYGYFSRIFKKKVGVSPREYKKMLNQKMS